MILELETERARLRRLNQNDLANLIRLESDADVVKHTRIRTPRTEEQSRQRLHDQINRPFVESPLGIWAAEFKDSGDFIGWFMLMPDDHRGAELGYMIVQDLWGKGLATEIAKMLVEKAFFALNLTSIHACTDEDNPASEKILEKIGFLYKGFNDADKAKNFEIRNQHWQPYLVGNLVSTEPMKEEHFEELFRVAKDPMIWKVHPNPLRYQKDEFRRFFNSGLARRGALILKKTDDDTIIGSSSFYEHSRQNRSVVIGYTFLIRECWGGLYNKDLKKIMLDYAFHAVDMVFFDVGESNVISQKALLKIGADLLGKKPDVDGQGNAVTSLRYQIHRESFLKNPFWSAP